MSERQQQRMRNLWKKAQEQAQQSLCLESGETWLWSHLNPKNKCKNPAPPLTQKQVPGGCAKVLPKKAHGANRGKARNATQRSFCQGGHRPEYNIRRIAKEAAEREEREKAAMKEISSILKQLTDSR